MKIEKILACVVAALVILCVIVYFTLPEQGEQIYIPGTQSVPEGVQIPDGYKLVDNYTDVYYVETEDGIKYYWLVQFSDGTYGWQEVDENGNIVFPNRETEPEETIPKEISPSETEQETTAPEETTGEAENTETTLPPAE